MKKNKLLEEIRKEIPTETRERVQREADKRISQGQYDPVKEMDLTVLYLMKYGMSAMCVIMTYCYYRVRVPFFLCMIGFAIVFVVWMKIEIKIRKKSSK